MADDKTSQDSKYYRFRVSIPRSAKQVLELIDNQENVSYAVLHILREWVAQNGTDSVFGKPVDPVVKRGRPKGSVTQAFSDGQDDENWLAIWISAMAMLKVRSEMLIIRFHCLIYRRL